MTPNKHSYPQREELEHNKEWLTWSKQDLKSVWQASTPLAPWRVWYNPLKSQGLEVSLTLLALSSKSEDNASFVLNLLHTCSFSQQFGPQISKILCCLLWL